MPRSTNRSDSALSIGSSKSTSSSSSRGTSNGRSGTGSRPARSSITSAVRGPSRAATCARGRRARSSTRSTPSRTRKLATCALDRERLHRQGPDRLRPLPGGAIGGLRPLPRRPRARRSARAPARAAARRRSRGRARWPSAATRSPSSPSSASSPPTRCDAPVMSSHTVSYGPSPQGLLASLAARSGRAARPRRAGARGALLAELDRRRRPEPERHLGDPAERRVDLGERHPVDRRGGRPAPPPRRPSAPASPRTASPRRRPRRSPPPAPAARARTAARPPRGGPRRPEDHRERRLPARRDRPTLLHQLARELREHHRHDTPHRHRLSLRLARSAGRGLAARRPLCPVPRAAPEHHRRRRGHAPSAVLGDADHQPFSATCSSSSRIATGKGIGRAAWRSVRSRIVPSLPSIARASLRTTLTQRASPPRGAPPRARSAPLSPRPGRRPRDPGHVDHEHRERPAHRHPDRDLREHLRRGPHHEQPAPDRPARARPPARRASRSGRSTRTTPPPSRSSRAAAPPLAPTRTRRGASEVDPPQPPRRGELHHPPRAAAPFREASLISRRPSGERLGARFELGEGMAQEVPGKRSGKSGGRHTEHDNSAPARLPTLQDEQRPTCARRVLLCPPRALERPLRQFLCG